MPKHEPSSTGELELTPLWNPDIQNDAMELVDLEHNAPVLQVYDDWSRLEQAVRKISEYVNYPSFDNEGMLDGQLTDVVLYVPLLLERYAELLELSHAMTKAWEDLNRSKDSLHVPDSAETAEVLANQGRVKL